MPHTLCQGRLNRLPPKSGHRLPLPCCPRAWQRDKPRRPSLRHGSPSPPQKQPPYHNISLFKKHKPPFGSFSSTSRSQKRAPSPHSTFQPGPQDSTLWGNTWELTQQVSPTERAGPEEPKLGGPFSWLPVPPLTQCRRPPSPPV